MCGQYTPSGKSWLWLWIKLMGAISRMRDVTERKRIIERRMRSSRCFLLDAAADVVAVVVAGCEGKSEDCEERRQQLRLWRRYCRGGGRSEATAREDAAELWERESV